MQLDTFTRAYINTALWSSTLPPFGTCPDCGKSNRILYRWNEDQEHVCDECSERESNYEPAADENYCIDDISPETIAAMIADCAKFQAENKWPDSDDSDAGHNFWLTRNGHGAGFWDGDYPTNGDELTAASKAYGQFDLYIGDNGKIYN